MGDPFYGQLTAVKTRYPLTSITWPYVGSSVEFTGLMCFSSLPQTILWIFIGPQAEVFSYIIQTSQKIEAPLLGLAKSIYYIPIWRRVVPVKSINNERLYQMGFCLDTIGTFSAIQFINDQDIFFLCKPYEFNSCNLSNYHVHSVREDHHFSDFPVSICVMCRIVREYLYLKIMQ